MKKNTLARKVLSSVLAIGMGGFVLPLAVQANSGLNENTVNIDGENYYVGSKGAANNVVIIDSDLDSGVIGGYTDDGAATGNRVNISGGTVTGNIYGGYTENGAAKGNTVILSGTSNLSKSTIYGGANKANDNVVSDNRLIVQTSGLTAENIQNFAEYEFYLPATVNPGDTGLTLTGEPTYMAPDGAATFYAGMQGIAGNETAVKVGDRFNFISNANGLITNQLTLTVQQLTDVRQGVAIIADLAVKTDSTSIYAEVTDVCANPQTAIATEARAGVTAFVNQGAEVVTDNLNMLSQSQEGINTFATVSGSNSKYDTGSYADINGWNSIVGIASTKEIGKDKLNYGAFFENGSGNYNTYNEIGGASFRGDGNVLYNGGGVIVRLDKENGFYTEAAVRAGSVKNEVNSGLTDALGKIHNYETENAYYGGHIGIGKIFKLENGKAWDIYGKYFHMHHEGDSVEIAGDRFDFDSVDSNKLRIGARFSEMQSTKLTSYYGLAWEYEFSGDVKGTAAGYDMHTPSLEGSTVIGEVGFRYAPGKESPWYFDANVKGYVGMQEGLSGSLQAVYSF